MRFPQNTGQKNPHHSLSKMQSAAILLKQQQHHITFSHSKENYHQNCSIDIQKRRETNRTAHLEAVELRAVPVAALRVVADGVARAQTDPVRERAVGLAQVAHEALHTESLVRRHF